MCLVAFIHKRMTGIGILSVCRFCGLSFLRVQLRLGDFVNFYKPSVNSNADILSQCRVFLSPVCPVYNMLH